MVLSPDGQEKLTPSDVGLKPARLYEREQPGFVDRMRGQAIGLAEVLEAARRVIDTREPLGKFRRTYMPADEGGRVTHVREIVPIVGKARDFGRAERATNQFLSHLINTTAFGQVANTAMKLDRHHGEPHADRTLATTRAEYFFSPGIQLSQADLNAGTIFPWLHDVFQSLGHYQGEVRQLNGQEAHEIDPKRNHALKAATTAVLLALLYAEALHISLEQAQQVMSRAALIMMVHDRPERLKQALGLESGRIMRNPTEIVEQEGFGGLLHALLEQHDVDIFQITSAQMLGMLAHDSQELGLDTRYGLGPEIEHDQRFGEQLASLTTDNTPLGQNFTPIDIQRIQTLALMTTSADMSEMVAPTAIADARKRQVPKAQERTAAWQAPEVVNYAAYSKSSPEADTILSHWTQERSLDEEAADLQELLRLFNGSYGALGKYTTDRIFSAYWQQNPTAKRFPAKDALLLRPFFESEESWKRTVDDATFHFYSQYMHEHSVGLDERTQLASLFTGRPNGDAMRGVFFDEFDKLHPQEQVKAATILVGDGHKFRSDIERSLLEAFRLDDLMQDTPLANPTLLNMMHHYQMLTFDNINGSLDALLSGNPDRVAAHFHVVFEQRRNAVLEKVRRQKRRSSDVVDAYRQLAMQEVESLNQEEDDVLTAFANKPGGLHAYTEEDIKSVRRVVGLVEKAFFMIKMGIATDDEIAAVKQQFPNEAAVTFGCYDLVGDPRFTKRKIHPVQQVVELEPAISPAPTFA